MVTRKRTAETATTRTSAFKTAQTRHRRQPDDPDRLDDLEELVDFSNGSSCCSSSSQPSSSSSVKNDPIKIKRIKVTPTNAKIDGFVEGGDADTEDNCSSSIGEDSCYYQGPLYGLTGFPGFLYAPGALSAELQCRIAHAAVSTFCELPHATNIDAVPPKPSEQDNRRIPIREGDDNNSSSDNCSSRTMWMDWKDEHGFAAENRNGGGDDDGGKSTSCACGETAQGIRKPSTAPTRMQETQRKKKYRSFKKLSWATLGYHYDWTARAYHSGDGEGDGGNTKKKDHWSPMPSLLERVAKIFAVTSLLVEAQQCQLSSSTSGGVTSVSSSPLPARRRRPWKWSAQACIVNYYNGKSSMGGHRDDLELALDKPLVSLSVGRPAVFLLGGTTKETVPVVPILVRPGDGTLGCAFLFVCYWLARHHFQSAMRDGIKILFTLAAL